MPSIPANLLRTPFTWTVTDNYGDGPVAGAVVAGRGYWLGEATEKGHTGTMMVPPTIDPKPQDRFTVNGQPYVVLEVESVTDLHGGTAYRWVSLG